jgi:hypothetical protein
MLVVDERVARDQKKQLLKFNGKLVTWAGTVKALRRLGLWRKGIILFDLIESRPHIQTMDGPFYRFGNTGCYAMEFAARQIHPHRGKIILHGMDFCGNHLLSKKQQKQQHCARVTWPRVLKALDKSAKFLRSNGITVFNGSPRIGPLDKFLRGWPESKKIVKK